MIKLHIAKQTDHLTYLLEKTDIFQSIDQNISTSPAHSRVQFEEILTTAFEAAAAEFSETLSHLKGLKLEKVCMIYSDECWKKYSVRTAALQKMTRELPMIFANECAVGQERCPRTVLEHDHVERGGYEGDVSSFVY